MCPIAFPRPVVVPSDLLYCPRGDGAVRSFFGNRRVTLRTGELVPMLDQQPVRLVGTRIPAVHAHQGPASFQLGSVQLKLQVAFGQSGVYVHKRRPGPKIPQHHRAAAVLTLGNCALEAAILYRMILNLHRESLVAGVETWTLGDGPTLEHAIPAKAKIVVQSSSIMLLNDKWKCGCLLALAVSLASARLRGDMEVAHRAIAR